MECINFYSHTHITGVTAEDFKQKVTSFSDEMEYGEEPVVKEEEVLIIEMDYRDGGNYRHSIAFALDAEGRVWVDEPEWNEDEEEDRISFWEQVYTLFGVVTPEEVYV